MKYVVKLTYETRDIIIEAPEGDSIDWEQEIALIAERYAEPIMELTDWSIREARANDQRPADNE